MKTEYSQIPRATEEPGKVNTSYSGASKLLTECGSTKYRLPMDIRKCHDKTTQRTYDNHWNDHVLAHCEAIMS